MHELFSGEFPCMLHEWLKIKVVLNSVVLLVEPIIWDKAKHDSLKARIGLKKGLESKILVVEILVARP
jgi:hypothetical protein